MTTRPLSVSTALFDGYRIEVALEEIRGAGVRLVEPAFIAGYTAFDESALSEGAAEGLARLLRKHDLSSLAASAHVNMGRPEAADLIRRRLRFAKAIGARLLITNAAPAGLADAFRRNLDEVLPVCEELNVVIAFENPGHGRSNLVGNGRDGVQLMRSVNSQFARLNYDFGNVFTYNLETVTPEEDFEIALPWIAHAHVKDVLSTPEGWTFTSVGDGSLRYDMIAARLAAIAPDLPVALELPLRLTRPGRRDPVQSEPRLPRDQIGRILRRSIDYWHAAEAAAT